MVLQLYQDCLSKLGDCIIYNIAHPTSLPTECEGTTKSYESYIFHDLTSNATNVRFIQREEWHAIPPRSSYIKLKLPLRKFIIRHTVTDSCCSLNECIDIMRDIQREEMVKQYIDIAYNFVIGGDGNIYVGRGWENVGAHTYPYNNCTIGVGLIGNFDTSLPNDRHLDALKALFEVGVKSQKIVPDYEIYGVSTGINVKNIIKKWKHWSKYYLNCTSAETML